MAVAVSLQQSCLATESSSQAAIDVAPLPAKPSKPETKSVLQQIKNSIKAVDLEEISQDPVEIRYELPSTSLTSTIGDVANPSKFNLTLSNRKNLQDNLSEIKNKAYKAALGGQIEAAIQLYKQALSVEPNNTNTIFALGSLYHHMHQVDDAKKMYKKVLEVDPSHAKAINNYIALMSEDSPNIALKELRELEQSNPEYAPVLAQIGMIYAKLQRYQEGEIYLRRAIAAAPEIINYRFNLAVLYDKAGAYDAAVKLYRQTAFAYGVGSSIPQSLDSINKRIAYLEDAITKEKLGGNDESMK